MKYYIDVDYYKYGSGYSHSTTVDSGECEEYLDIEEIVNEWSEKDEDGWETIIVRYYADGADPMYDEPIKVETVNETIR